MRSLSELVSALMCAKHNEEDARNERVKIEEEIAEQVPTDENGQKTIAVDDVKITVKRGLSYKADTVAITQLAFDKGLQFAPIKTKTTTELDEKGYEWYKKNNKEAYDILSKYVTVTPRKVQVTIKES